MKRRIRLHVGQLLDVTASTVKGEIELHQFRVGTRLAVVSLQGFPKARVALISMGVASLAASGQQRRQLCQRFAKW